MWEAHVRSTGQPHSTGGARTLVRSVLYEISLGSMQSGCYNAGVLASSLP
jgi:hypothetical protein